MDQKVYICENCGKEFTEDYRKDKEFIKKNPPRFCSLSCKNISSNKGNLGKTKIIKCEICGKLKEIPITSRSTICPTCRMYREKSLKLRGKRPEISSLCPLIKYVNKLIKDNKDREREKIKSQIMLKNKNQEILKRQKESQAIFKCSYCDRVFLRINNKHCHELYCKENPNRIQCKGHPVSPEVRKRISQTQKENFKDGHSRYPFTRAEDSYPEKYFMKWLNKFTTYEHNYHVDRYFLDFAWPGNKTYIEVNGSQHYETEKAILHDKERFKILNNLGWACLAIIKWSDYKVLPKKEQKEFLNNLENKIRGIESGHATTPKDK